MELTLCSLTLLYGFYWYNCNLVLLYGFSIMFLLDNHVFVGLIMHILKFFCLFMSL